jgi:hypothetical protein
MRRGLPRTACLCTALACLPARDAGAQVVNIDREAREDTVHHRWGAFANVSLSSDKQKNNLLDVSGNIEVDRYFRNDYLLLTLFRNDAVFNGREAIQNEGMFHLLFRDRDTRKVSPESFVQYQWNGAWGMEARYLAGANLRFKLMEERKADLYLASGLFHEWERWNWSGVKDLSVPTDAGKVRRDMFRLNQYVKYAVKLNESVDISAVSYLQFPLGRRFLQPRWFLDANLFLQAARRLTLVLHWDHVWDHNRVVPIEAYYYSFSTGLQYAL